MPLYALGDHRPEIDPDNWVAPDATVLGNVVLKAGTSVWFGAVIRGDNDPILIGEASNIQDHSVLHTDVGYPLTIGRGVTVGHRVMLHGCTIGDNSLIGIGSVILNGARIGRDCLIGANTLITERKVIPDGSLVMGQPGRVVRPLEPGQIEDLTTSAEHYVQNARRYAAELERILG
jgi:carbonic anhydrase/acetyltransferase-like protein (isoleucine patch superfamily)